MSGDNNPYLEFVKLKILTDINIQISPVDDDTFRYGNTKIKVLKDKTTIEGCYSELILVQNLNGYTIDLKHRQNNSIYSYRFYGYQNSGGFTHR